MRAHAAVDVVETADELEALAPEWEALWRRCPAATPFQAPAWLVPWWHHFEPGRLAAIAVRRRGSLAGLLPLYRDDRSGRACLRLLGAGNSDYLDAIVDPAAQHAAHHLLHALEDLRCDGAEVRLERLPESSPLLRGDERARRVTDSVEWEAPCPTLALPHRADAVWKQVRYARARLGRMDGFSIDAADASTLDAALSRLAELHQTRWRERGESGIFDDPRARDFLSEAASALLEGGLLRLYLLHLAGDVVAAHLGMVAKGRAYYYVGGFDPAAARLSIGTVLVAHAIEAAESEGAREFDFLRGGEAYKYRWGAEDRWTSRRVFPPLSTRGSRQH
jgi:CelD/BcsL family acetyltransferase involved in cellulose biosynthesis